MSGSNDLPPPPGAPGAVFAPPAATPPPAGGPTPASIIKRMMAHLLVALVLLAVGLAVTTVLARQRKPTWASETVILYREGINKELIGIEGAGQDLKALPARLKETMLARQSLERLVKEFNLYPQLVAGEGYIAAVDKFRSKITFKPKSPETFLIAFEGSTAEEAQQVTARLADILIKDWTERNHAKARKEIEYLEDQKKRADEELDKREAELVRFVALHPEFAAENNAEQVGSAVRTEKAKAIADPEILALDRQQQRIRTAIAARNAPGIAAAGGAAPAAGANPAAALIQQKQAVDAELAAAQRDLSDKSEKLTDAHPDVRMAKSRVQAAMDKQREVTAKLIAATPADPLAPAPKPAADDDPYETKAPDPTKRLQAELSKNERELQMRKRGVKPDANASDFANQIIELETEWRRLNREREKAKGRQGYVDGRLAMAQRNTESELQGYNAQVMVLDEAFLPTMPGTMPKEKFVAIGIAVSILVSLIGAAAFGVLADDRVFVAQELAGLAPVLAAVPRAPTPKKAKKGKARA